MVHEQDQNGRTTIGNSGLTITFRTNTQANSTVAGAVWWNNITTTLSTVTVQGNTATLVNNPLTGSTRSSASFYYAGVTAASCAVVATLSDSVSTDTRMVAHEISGVSLTAPFDKNDQGSQASPGPGTTTDGITSFTNGCTPTKNGEYLLGITFPGAGRACVAGTGFTIAANVITSVSEYLIQTTAASQNGTFTQSTAGSESYHTWILTFRPATPTQAMFRGH